MTDTDRVEWTSCLVDGNAGPVHGDLSTFADADPRESGLCVVA
jgi:hypothetical protein